MKKDKLITIRVNEQVREKFNQWCNEQGLSASEFLSNIIDDCVSGNYEMSSNNKDRSQKIARQRLIALEAKLEEMSSQIASLTQRSQKEAISLVSALQQPQPDFDITDKVKVLEKQIGDVSSQGDSISKLIDDKLDKNELDGLVESKFYSIFDVDSLYKTLDDKLDTKQVEVLVENKIDSLFNFNELSEQLDNKLDKDELEALVKSQVESILIESYLVKQIETKLHNTIDKQEVQTLVQSLVDSTLNQVSLGEMIDKMIDEKLMNQVSPPQEVVREVTIDDLGDISSTGNDEESIDNPDDISSTENDQPIIEQTDKQSENTEEVSPEKEVSVEVESEESIAEAIDDVEDTQQQIQIPLAFQQLPLGVVKVTALAKSLGISHVTLGRIADKIDEGKSYNIDFFPQLWDYVKFESVKKKDANEETKNEDIKNEDTKSEDTESKKSRVWKKIK